MFNDLRDYIKHALELGECKIIEDANWDLEIGAVTDIISKSESPMILFDKIKDYAPGYRVLTNPFGSYKLVSLVFGLPPSNKGLDLVKAWRERNKGGFKSISPIQVKTGPVMENVLRGDDVNLFKFPTPRWHEGDGGRYIGTGCIVITRDPDSGWVNLGTYRVQIHDEKTATIQIDDGHDGDIMRKKYWLKGLACPVAVVCGQDPVLTHVGALRLPYGTSEYDYAGWMRGQPIEVIRGQVTDLPIPATAEIVLEGEIVPPEVETRIEGPFGEYPGYYAGHPSPQAAFRVKSILHRDAPILLGNPPSKTWPSYWHTRNIGMAAMIWDAIERRLPGIKGVWIVDDAAITMPVISIEQQFAGHAKAAAMIVMGSSLFCRFIVVVDDDVDPSNISEVLWAISTRCDPKTGIEILSDIPSNIKDPLVPPDKRELNYFATSVGIIMACKPYNWIKDFPPVIKASPDLLKKIENKWPGISNTPKS